MKDTIEQITALPPDKQGDLFRSRPPAYHLAASVFSAMKWIFHAHHQLEAERTEMACEASLHTLACFQHARSASRGHDSSKTGSRCGHTQPMPLYKRTYRCENCGLLLDRDENSAVNHYQRFFARLPSTHG